MYANLIHREAEVKFCARCKKEIEVDKYFSRKSICPKCGGDLHICLNCVYYSESAHNKCREPKAEFQWSREKANFCDYFSFMEGAGPSSPKEKEDALKRLDDLFKR
jgi:hypothetical protein